MVTRSRNRFDGWKAIAAYFRRDRTTVMRWAAERDLPVHRIPGGKQNSVFAYEDELAEWIANGNSPTPVQDNEQDGQTSRLANRVVGSMKWLLVGAIPLVLIYVFVAFSTASSEMPARFGDVPAMPRGPSVAVDYATARDLWGRRTAKDLGQSIALYEEVIKREPDFAPAYAGLADAWLVFREYGDMGEAKAYENASDAVDKALKLDPDLASAHRAKGFIDYWWHYDATGSLASFQKALDLDPKDGLTHFWYANVLSDIGKHDVAQREYDIAQLLLPGTSAIEVERACALWQAGDDRAAIAALDSLVAKYPSDATVHNCLAWAKIGSGDIAGYSDELRAMASIRKEPKMLQLSHDIDQAISSDPKKAHLVLIADARRELANGERQTRMTPAFYASAMGDRVNLLALVSEAVNVGEKWQSANLVNRIASKWKTDAQIAGLIEKLRASPSADPA